MTSRNSGDISLPITSESPDKIPPLPSSPPQSPVMLEDIGTYEDDNLRSTADTPVNLQVEFDNYDPTPTPAPVEEMPPMTEQEAADAQYFIDHPLPAMLHYIPKDAEAVECTPPSPSPSERDLRRKRRNESPPKKQALKYHAPSLFAVKYKSFSAAQHFDTYEPETQELFQLCMDRHFELIKTPIMEKNGPPQIVHKLMRHEVRAFLYRVNRWIAVQVEDRYRVDTNRKPSKVDAILFTAAARLAESPKDMDSRNMVKRCLESIRATMLKRKAIQALGDHPGECDDESDLGV